MTTTNVGVFEWQKAFAEAPKAGLNASACGVAWSLAHWATTATGADIRPSQASIARATGLSDRTVSRALASLVQAGWLSVVAEATPYAPAEYRYTVPADAASRPRPEADRSASRVDDVSGGTRTPVTTARAPVAPHPSEFRTTYPSTYPRTSPSTYPGQPHASAENEEGGDGGEDWQPSWRRREGIRAERRARRLAACGQSIG